MLTMSKICMAFMTSIAFPLSRLSPLAVICCQYEHTSSVQDWFDGQTFCTSTVQAMAQFPAAYYSFSLTMKSLIKNPFLFLCTNIKKRLQVGAGIHCNLGRLGPFNPIVCAAKAHSIRVEPKIIGFALLITNFSMVS